MFDKVQRARASFITEFVLQDTKNCLRIKTNAFSRSFFRCVKKVSCKKTRELRIENSVKINDKFEIYI